MTSDPFKLLAKHQGKIEKVSEVIKKYHGTTTTTAHSTSSTAATSPSYPAQAPTAAVGSSYGDYPYQSSPYASNPPGTVPVANADAYHAAYHSAPPSCGYNVPSNAYAAAVDDGVTYAYSVEPITNPSTAPQTTPPVNSVFQQASAPPYNPYQDPPSTASGGVGSPCAPDAAAAYATPAAATAAASTTGARPAQHPSPFLAPISANFVTTADTTLVFKEKKASFTGDGATIKDSGGNTVFKVQASVLSFSERRQLVDARGNVVGQLRKKRTPTLQSTIYAGPPSDEKKIKIKAVGILNPFNSNAKIYVDGVGVWRASGNWRAKKFTIAADGGVLVATVSRKTTAASLFLGADSYCIDIRPGVDMAFISLVVIALDELYHDEEGGAGDWFS